ncbi:hypothetical protein SERLA73DRAFT_90203 [Serpula lacrymans var. lacrymans S7.3]|uniref:MARVEL domain-containing protein n=2 Tax=Serpula lacrymans var. lacrymans TaxID=341189 RepID=F8PYT4_SERL3|nr:uncharacterized protein SERLADRAFT_468204 [Serpula lacrymans var. lacrymans S7.9]EGN99047.1 hypothetical protein SERLA73DRAFT_90203 [Serpula lacrymans var. lacrymans S7.3]EGO24622.1 hypothetical protein SERLADRAFT_468204 [Serpula lacrymans var. lacrymans S7.9]
MSGGIGSGHGMVPFEDDMIISKPAIIFHISQVFFNFLAMACFASVASFQAHWGVGPSGLSGFAIFVSVSGIFLALFMLFVPVIYEKYDRFARLARAMKEVRVGFILTGTGVTLSLLIAFIVTISAWTEPGCKDANNDPNAGKGDGFKNGLPGWCSTKKAAAIFFWLAFAFWAASLGFLILQWRNGSLTTHARDPPFTRPDIEEGDEEEEEEDTTTRYQQVPVVAPSSSAPRRSTYDNSDAVESPFSDPVRYSGAASSTAPTSGYTSPPAASRPSMDAYGAFSDPAPSGFGGVSHNYAPPPADAAPRVSRTMQYADPYAAVRASLAPSAGGPPSYESYAGYR